MKQRSAFKLAVVFCLVMIIDPSRAWAVLGETVGSIESDRIALSGQLRMIPAQLYTIQEITTSEFVLSEYVSGNTVFAVAWRGKRPPNLVSLLGLHFQEYQDASAAAASSGPMRRGMSHVEGAHVVVETGGHPGDIRGRAYLPSLLPSGVTKEMIQ